MDHRIKPQAVLMQLNRILESKKFSRAFRIKRLLKFLVDETLAGRSYQIKAYTIALAVFDRKADFNPQIDPIIRINAGRLRRYLDEYYESRSQNEKIQISIPKGSYVPIFKLMNKRPEKLNPHQKNNTIEIPNIMTGKEKARAGYIEPVVAVLPFTDLDNGKTEQHFLDGLPDELSSELALFPDLRVIDYFTMAQFKDSSIGIMEIGHRLNADFLISGSIKTADDSIKIRVSLSETQNAVQLWTKVFKHPLTGDSISKTLEHIIHSIIGAVAGDYGAIYSERKKNLPKKMPKALTHYEAIFLHRQSQLTGKFESQSLITETMERILGADPEYAIGWAILSEVFCDQHSLNYSESGKSLKLAYSYAKKAIQKDPSCQYAHYAMALVYVLQRDTDNAIESSKKVLSLNPNSAFMAGGAALWLCICGNFEQGLPALRHSIKLNPLYPGYLHHAPFLFHLKQGDYQKAMIEAERFHMPNLFWSYLDKAAVMGLVGRLNEARILLEKIIELQPDFAKHTGHYVRSFVIEKDVVEKIMTGLKKAGLHTIKGS